MVKRWWCETYVVNKVATRSLVSSISFSKHGSENNKRKSNFTATLLFYDFFGALIVDDKFKIPDWLFTKTLLEKYKNTICKITVQSVKTKMTLNWHWISPLPFWIEVKITWVIKWKIEWVLRLQQQCKWLQYFSVSTLCHTNICYINGFIHWKIYNSYTKFRSRKITMLAQ